MIEEQKKKGVKVFKVKKLSELDIPQGSENFRQKMIEMTKNNLPPNYEELKSQDKKEVFEKAEDKVLDWYLRFGNQRPDKETLSPREVAANIAVLIDKYVKLADRISSGGEVDIWNLSHKGTLEPFLREVLIRKVKNKMGGEEIIKGFKNLEEIGGGMRPIETFVITIKTDESGDKIVSLLLRGQNYELDMEKLKELVNLYEKSVLDKIQSYFERSDFS